MTKLIDIIVGARPNFIKVAAIINELQIRLNKGMDIGYRLIHTGQHYDKRMSGIFFEELNIPFPNINLGVGHGNNAQQVATIIDRYSNVLHEQRPDMVIVSGDVNSTVACALATKKTDPSISLAHVEAGLRSRDRLMPEEMNRILTDSISDYFFTTSRSANDNLLDENVAPEKIFFVGNTMIDTLKNNINKFKKPAIWDSLQLAKKEYIVLTLHRHANISEAKTLKSLLEAVGESSRGLPVIFPVHPHTAKMMESFGIFPSKICMIEPMGYLEFNYLVKHSKAVVTDSGGISEETTVMNVPCMTLRSNTERPETCTIGTNLLLGNSHIHNIERAFERLFKNEWQIGKTPELWDGDAAKRIVDTIANALTSSTVSVVDPMINLSNLQNSILHNSNTSNNN
jgi:UDP-N-acetylglucosamine 2-epimerase (non-hydrolysing)